MPEASVTFSWTDWHWHPEVLIGLVLLEDVYLLGVGPLRRHYHWAEGVDVRQVATFSLGVLVLFLALQSPLHDLSDEYLFSAHMVQHLLMMMLAAPLLLLGTPGWLLRPLLGLTPVARAARLLTFPLVVFAAFNAVLLGWHLPEAYDLTLRNHSVHILEHLMFLAVGVLAWWPIMSPLPQLPRLVPPVQMLYLFAQSVPMGILGAVITFAPDVLYPWYEAAPRVWDISPIVDQQIGGVIMKTAGSLVFLLALSIVFFTWVSREEAEERRGREVGTS